MSEHSGKHLAKAAVWTMLGRMLSLSLKFLTVPILARILSPEEFGVIAASITVILFVAMLGGGGLASALIADKRDSPALWSQVFNFTFFLGCGLAAILYFSADTVSGWLGAEDIELVLKVLCFLIPLQIVGDVSEALLTKRLQFDKMAIWQVTADTVGAIAAIVAAFSGWGVWALVIQQFLSAAIRVIGNLYAAAYVPRWVWSFSDVRSLGHFGGRVVISDLLLYLCIQGPTAIVTRMLGTQATGFFSVPNRFVELPNQIILSSIATVLFPSFASMADEPKRLSRALLRSSQLTTALQAPVLFGLAAIAEPAMDVLFGDKWIEAWPVFAILALSKGVMAPCGGFGSFLKGIGKVELLWQITGLRAFFVLMGCVVGASLNGLVGLVLGILLANTVIMLVYSLLVFKVAAVGLFEGMSSVFWLLFQAIFMAGIVHFVLSKLQYSSVVEVMVAVGVGGVVYGAMIMLFQSVTKEAAFKLVGKS